MGNKKEGHQKGVTKKGKNEHASNSKRKESKITDISKKKTEISKHDEKKGKHIPPTRTLMKEPKKHRDSKQSPRKILAYQHKRTVSLTKKGNIKDHDKKKGDDKNKKIKNIEKHEQKTNNAGCFLCFCCGGGENNDMQTELLLEDMKRKEEEEEAARRKKEEELKKRKEEEMRRKREEEEEKARRRKEEEEAAIIQKRKEEELRKRMEEEVETKLSEYEKMDDETIIDENQLEQSPQKTVLKKIGIKSKQPPKKAKLNFTGAAAAPPPPPVSACIGLAPKSKSNKVNLGEGIYLIYDSDNNGQLKLCYSKNAINKNGVLAYIQSKNIPSFYFEKNNGENILVNNVSKIMQSTFINDRKPYYENWVEFIKMTKQFNGTLYLLPGSDLQPPPKMEIVFLDSKQKKLYPTQIEKPINFQGDCLLVIHHGLDIFKKEVNVTDLLSYIGSYGAYSEI